MATDRHHFLLAHSRRVSGHIGMYYYLVTTTAAKAALHLPIFTLFWGQFLPIWPTKWSPIDTIFYWHTPDVCPIILACVIMLWPLRRPKRQFPTFFTFKAYA